MLKPKNLAQQMILVMVLSLLLLLITVGAVDILTQKNLAETARSNSKISQLSSLLPIVNILNNAQLKLFEDKYSSCHQGYLVQEMPYQTLANKPDTDSLERDISRLLSIPKAKVKVGFAVFNQSDFAYQKCGNTLDFPFEGLVISMQLDNGQWLNAEVHEHEWHLNIFHRWLFWAIIAYIIIATISIFIIGYLTRPLALLNAAAKQFSTGLEFSAVEESGSPDLRQTIRSFNTMQKDVLDAIKNRTTTLAAISHDIRTPLTALRLKAELLDDEKIRNSFIKSIDKIERITASGLAFLKGDDKVEPTKHINLTALIASECIELKESGYEVHFIGQEQVNGYCRPVALSRAIRNLIENAIKYGKSAEVDLTMSAENIQIIITDSGPGIPEQELANAFEPFYRLSKARESSKGGFGLGLAIVKIIIEGHGGKVCLENSKPHGLKAIIQLPYIH